MKFFKTTAKEAEPDFGEKKNLGPNLKFLLPGLLICLLGLGLAAGLLWQAQNNSSQKQRQALIEAWGGSQAAALQQAVRQLGADAAAAARDPALIDSLQSGDTELIRATERRLTYRDGVLDTHLNLRGQATQNRNRTAPINFAALDMLRRVESGQQAAPEAYRIGDRWVVYQATAVRQSDEGPIVGSLLFAADVQRLLGNLLPLPDGTGQLRILQRFPNAAQQVLAELGSSGRGAPVSYDSGNINWQLEFIPGPGIDAAPSSTGLLILAGLIVLVSCLLALYATLTRLYRPLQADVEQLTQMLRELSSGKSIKAFSLRLPVLDLLAKSLARMPQRKSEANTSNGTGNGRSEHHPAAGALDLDRASDPLFLDTDILDTDILDIDILDEDLDLLGLEQTSPMNSIVQAPPRLPADIFRAYDIRGVVGASLTAETAYWIGRAIGSESLAQGEPNVSVGRDGRLSGPELVGQLIQGLLDCGCQVTDIGMVPTPVLYYAANILAGKSGVMLTGSHNPPDYNGFKIVIAGDTLANEQIQALRQRIESNDLASSDGSVEQVDVLGRYFKQIRDDIAVATPMKVVVDCGNGAAGVIAPQLIEALGCSVIPLFCDVDGNFPNHHPDPGKPENLVDLIAAVKEHNADLGLAFDGDGDRVGVVTNTGTIVYPDRLLMLFAKDVVSRNPGADIIFDVKCTRRLTPLISGYGGRPVMWKTGHSLIKKKMKETGALLAGEMSGHIFFKERWFGFDDGIYSAARLLEILSQDKRDAEQVFASFPNDISTPEINITVTETRKFHIIEALQRDGHWGDANITALDGVRVDYPKGWGLVRASNTTPVLVLRFEAETQEELERIQDVFRAQLYTVAPDLNLPF